MAKRILKEYNQRRTEILDTAEKLFYIYGYDTTPVDRIIEAASISKGTFYYYFKSKDELLDTLAMERAKVAFARIDEMVFNTRLSALERMKLYFESSKSWKMENREMLKALIKVLYAPSNLPLRQKFLEKQAEMARPTLSRIIRQGVEEGVFTTRYSDDIAETIFTLFSGIGASMPTILQEIEEDPGKIDLLLHKIEVYQDLFERILGAPEGSIKFADKEYIKKYLLEDGKPAGEQTVKKIHVA